MPAAVDVKDLSALTPIKELSEAGLKRLLGQVETTRLPAGRKLHASDERENAIYLLDGLISLVCRGNPTRVKGGSDRARLPLFSDRVQGEFALAEAPSTLLKVNKQAFSDLLNQERTSGFEVVDTEATAEEGAIVQQLYLATAQKKLELPPMPEVAMRIQKMADDPNVGVNEITQVVQMDPAVAGALLHATNSPLYRTAKQISNIRDAVVRLGFNTTKTLAFNLAMRQTFQSDSSLVRERIHQVWEHSVNVSAIAYVLARHLRGFDPDRALLAGLMHRIGAVPILNFIGKNRLELGPEAMEEAVNKLNALAGVLVMNYWGMDDELIAVVEQADQWMRNEGPKADYCDLVIVSQLFALRDTPKGQALPRTDEVPAFAKLELGPLDENLNLEVLKEAEGELQMIRQVLHG
ncbi:HDOD domain-containing protein [Ectothiorhodospira haloalkaliphila]|uniref:HDOD domain-containing protein n=1 Tax=Ectothiorhodospira haloalkaliphila TaxID=421628 RepID=UPI001EE8793B|nr:HDOD domain-containing protein [Ectothiorhodospira haloalkaliphila]MCG5523625.1 HDOD domain-containing protein [Ectothiorhodospira haloalkaliphila]